MAGIEGYGETEHGLETVASVELFLKQSRQENPKPEIISDQFTNKIPQAITITPKITPTTTEVIIEHQSPEKIQISKQEQEQLLGKMGELKAQVVTKFKDDLQRKRLIERSVSHYKRTVKMNGGELIIFYEDASINKNIRLFWEKKIEIGFGDIIRSEEKSVRIDQGGYFQISITTTTPSDKKGSREVNYINKNGQYSVTNKEPKEIEKKAEEIVNLYLQADKSVLETLKSKLETVKKFLPPIFHK